MDMNKYLIIILYILNVALSTTGCIKQNSSIADESLKTPIVRATQSISVPYVFINKWNEEFQYTIETGVDSEGNLYIADKKNKCIQKFSSEGEFIKKWGSEGSEDGQFKIPAKVAIDTDNNIYVVDCDNGRIQKFDSEGNFMAKWGDYACYGGITTDSDDKIYVADIDRVYIFNSDGKLLNTWDWSNIFRIQPYITGITADNSGFIYIVVTVDDIPYSSIYKCNKDGEFAKLWGDIEEGYWTIEGVPVYLEDNLLRTDTIGGIVTDSEGNVLVTDTGNNEIDIYDSNGKFITSFGSEGSGDGQFNNPTGITIDNKGNLYVIDSGNYRIQKFAPNPEFKTNN